MCPIFFFNLAVYIVFAQQLHIAIYPERNQAPILLATSNIITPVQINLTFFIQLFYLVKIRKAPLLQSSAVSSQAGSLLFTFKEEPGLRVRKSQILTRSQPVSEVKNPSVESLKQAWLRNQV